MGLGLWSGLLSALEAPTVRNGWVQKGYGTKCLEAFLGIRTTRGGEFHSKSGDESPH